MIKKLLFFLFMWILMCFKGFGMYITNVPYTTTQPNGEEITIYWSGDEFFSWYHDKDGYFIVYNETTKYYEYASFTKSRQESTGVKVSSRPTKNVLKTKEFPFDFYVSNREAYYLYNYGVNQHEYYSSQRDTNIAYKSIGNNKINSSYVVFIEFLSREPSEKEKVDNIFEIPNIAIRNKGSTVFYRVKRENQPEVYYTQREDFITNNGKIELIENGVRYSLIDEYGYAIVIPFNTVKIAITEQGLLTSTLNDNSSEQKQIHLARFATSPGISSTAIQQVTDQTPDIITPGQYDTALTTSYPDSKKILLKGESDAKPGVQYWLKSMHTSATIKIFGYSQRYTFEDIGIYDQLLDALYSKCGTHFKLTTEAIAKVKNTLSSDKTSVKEYFSEVSYGQLDLKYSYFYDSKTETDKGEDTNSVVLRDYRSYMFYKTDYSKENEIQNSLTLLKNLTNESISVMYAKGYTPSTFTAPYESTGFDTHLTFVLGNDKDEKVLIPQHLSTYSVNYSFSSKIEYKTGNKIKAAIIPYNYANSSVISHEYFHSFGAPDQYILGYEGLVLSAAKMSLMSSDAKLKDGYKYTYGPHMTAYEKARYGKWMGNDNIKSWGEIPDGVVINHENYDRAEPFIMGCLSSDVRDRKYFIIKSMGEYFKNDEYFVVEYRSEFIGDFDKGFPRSNQDDMTPRNGLIVYRVNNSNYKIQIPNVEKPVDVPYIYVFRTNGYFYNTGENLYSFEKGSNVGHHCDIITPVSPDALISGIRSRQSTPRAFQLHHFRTRNKSMLFPGFEIYDIQHPKKADWKTDDYSKIQFKIRFY